MALEQKNRKEESGRPLYKILLIVFAIGLAVCIGIVIRNAVVKNKAEKQLEELAAGSTEAPQESEAAETETETENDILAELGIEVPEKNLDWEELAKTNEDIYAWIHIPGTQVDYPVLQNEKDENYYLDHNLDGSSGYPGCIYTHTLNSKEFTDPNTILYGHNMKNGSMFGCLHDFEDNAFFEENRYIYVYTPEKTLVYEIFTASEFSDAHLMFAYDWSTTDGFEQFVEDVTSVRDMNAHVKDGMEVTAGNHLITLSTCINGKPQKRWLVTGVLVNDKTTYEISGG